MTEIFAILKNVTAYLAAKEGNKWMKIQEQLLDLEKRFYEVYNKPRRDRKKLDLINLELKLLRKSIDGAIRTKNP